MGLSLQYLVDKNTSLCNNAKSRLVSIAYVKYPMGTGESKQNCTMVLVIVNTIWQEYNNVQINFCPLL